MSASVASVEQDLQSARRKAVMRQDLAFQIALWRDTNIPPQWLQNNPEELVRLRRRLRGDSVTDEAVVAEVETPELVAKLQPVKRDFLSISSDPALVEQGREAVDENAASAAYHASRASWKPIAKAICEAYGITFTELLSTRRERRVVLARHAAMYWIKEKTPLSYPEIGRRLGRDHTSVLHGVRKHAERIGRIGASA